MSKTLTSIFDDKFRIKKYKQKKAMSSAVFKYFMNATPAQQLAMNVEVDVEVQDICKNPQDVVNSGHLGDALLHCLDASLCQASRYRQLILTSPTLHKNRTVVIAVLPDRAFWIVLECLLNQFTLQDMGVYKTHIFDKRNNRFYFCPI